MDAPEKSLTETGWLGTHDLTLAVGAALTVAVGLAAFRLWSGGKPRAVLLGLLGVGVSAVVALYTGRQLGVGWAVRRRLGGVAPSGSPRPPLRPPFPIIPRPG